MNKKIIVEDTSPIFKFVKPEDNYLFSKMSGSDLLELINLLDNYYLELRSSLGFDKNISFGVEIEVEHAKENDIKRNLSRYLLSDEWQVKDDGSLTRGAEIISPILRDDEENWKDLWAACSILNSYSKIGNNAGGHVHIGAQILGNDTPAYLNLIKLWSVYENIIFRFSYGVFLKNRPRLAKYAEPMTKDFCRYYNKFKDENLNFQEMIKFLSRSRYHAINFCNVNCNYPNSIRKGNTIEFRCPNGSVNPVIWQNNINLFVKLLNYAKSEYYDDDIINKRHNLYLDKYAGLNWYNEIFLDEALEFCDLIYDNNFDKIYFLRQYLKSMETSDKYIKTKTMTKNEFKVVKYK